MTATPSDAPFAAISEEILPEVTRIFPFRSTINRALSASCLSAPKLESASQMLRMPAAAMTSQSEKIRCSDHWYILLVITSYSIHYTKLYEP